jgi:hypothetical protein
VADLLRRVGEEPDRVGRLLGGLHAAAGGTV